MIKVLVSDDNIRLFDPWTERAARFGIDLKCFSNWEEAQYELETNWDAYAFIILDGKGKIQEDAAADNPKHLIAAVQWLKDQLRYGKFKPAVVYTGYYDFVEEIVIKDEQTLEIFDKGKSEIDDVFQFILKQVEKNPERIIKAEHPDVFEIFDAGLLGNNMKNEFLNLCTELKESNPNENIGTLRRIRPIIENVILKLYQTDNSLIPDSLFNKGIPEMSKIIYHLSGKPQFNKQTRELEYHAEQILPEHISYVLNFLYDITSKVAMHDYAKEVTNYIVKSSFFALIEFLIWFKNFYKTNYR